MNLVDRLRNGVRALAATKPKPDTSAEIGAAGDFTALYLREESRKDDISIDDYKKMLDNDGTVEAIYNMITLPIKGANYHFEVEKGGEAELQLVEDNFSLPPQQGGMSLPFDLMIADMLRAVTEGFRLYEKVWTLQNGKFVYKKLAPRDATGVFLKRDDNGGFDGADQRTWSGSKYTNVFIPPERCFLFTYGKERSFLYGRSAFKSAHYHYDRKHKLYYLQQLGAQTAAVPPRKLGVPDSVFNNPTKLAEAEAAADSFGVMQRITLPEGFTLDEYKTSPIDLQAAISHHDTLIARSIMAQSIVLGSSGKSGASGGSFSLSKDQTEMFIEGVQGLMRQIEHHINAFLIPDLIDYNFGSGRYPEFKFEDIAKDTKTILSNAFTTVLARQDVPGYVIEGIAAQLADELGIDLPTQGQLDKKKGSVDTANQNSDRQRSTFLAEGGYYRQLTEAEKRVNLADMAKRGDTVQERLTKDSVAFYSGLKDDTVKRLTTMLNKKDYAGLKSFSLASFGSYRKTLENAMMEQYLYGKRTAADEISAKMPQTPSKSRQYVTQQAQAVADKQESDLTFAVKAEVTKELRKANLSTTYEFGIADIMSRVATAFLAFQDGNVAKGIAVSLAGSLNLGRGDSFGASDDIDRMQYSAILDNRTTQMCTDLDSSVVSYEEYQATIWIPPCHFGCRSIWVAIMKDDDAKPDFRPIPKSPGGFDAPQL